MTSARWTTSYDEGYFKTKSDDTAQALQCERQAVRLPIWARWIAQQFPSCRNQIGLPTYELQFS